jgi:precorrin-2 dehydrogenase/sirohydrochlorin ferrochelatase
MIPIYLDPAVVRVAVVGLGELAQRRVAWLKQAGAQPDLWAQAPARFDGYQAIWIAGLACEAAASIAKAAREAGVLVNVEDVPALCDFHTPAVVRRGKLTLAAGTGGASPAVARAARERLQAAFPERWGQALDEIAHARAALRLRDASCEALIADARVRLAKHDLL